MAHSVFEISEKVEAVKTGSDTKVKSDSASSDHEKQDQIDDIVGGEPKLQRRLKSRHLQMIAIGMSILTS